MTRIIAGRAKGRRIDAPKGDRTRPTTERTREALFSALASWFGAADRAPDEHLAGIAVLDLFGGSGAIGLESASRGAGPVVILEGDPSTAKLIRGSARATKLHVDVIAGKLPGALEQVVGEFDFVFVDPPYDFGPEGIDELLAALVAGGKLTGQALVVVERSRRSRQPAWPEEFTETWSRRYGEATLYFGSTD
ncbi:MAG: hypothetical protein GX596_08330 [Propionibacterium sp.]|nr:hypothetical protein [Propionibacterium sp.]